ncbi:DNA polymerase III subunit beta [Sphingomonas sp. ABOLE]|uniref:DNA polymerase III subunit beta n=1 Tax=Sphingomonas sp. ABOLE TaxID=1985878 RepID=UPI000F7F9EEF|nr:DNA polymerase III subunit beta [Sphingomonas sp. ABOLE]RSV44399.1 DNA polymerase III subunit beta [Sphingomonas sp. ABOLE]
MTITLEAKQLRAIAVEAKDVATSSGGSAPIFSNVLIREEAEGRVVFVATDLDTAIERQLVAVRGDLARAPLRTTVSAKYLADITAKLPKDAQVKLEHADGKLKLTSGRARFVLSTLPAEDFPAFPRADWDADFEIGGNALAELYDRLNFAISTDATRYYLGGIFLHRVEIDGQAMLRAAATDGHRLARAQIPLPEGAEGLPQPGVILPRPALKVIRGLIDHMPPDTEDTPRTIGVAVTSSRAEFDFGKGEHGETRFTCKLIDGTFPDYARVIPTSNDKLLTVEKAALREAVARVATIISDKTRVVKLQLAGELVTVSATSVEAGQATEEVPCSWTGGPLDIGFNAAYLQDVLGAIESDTVAAEIQDAGASTLWRADKDPDALFVLMPVRV